MNVPTIEIPREQAIKAYREYRQAVRDNPNPEDRACMLGYQALVKGQSLVNVLDAMRTAGLDEQGRPRLAIGRATWEYTYYRHELLATIFSPSDPPRPRTGIRFPADIFPRTGEWRARALTPSIPPRLRPARNLGKYWILWEADWQAVPGDPMLLRRIRGWLFAVLAVWDLTPLERAVLGQRMAPRL